MSDNQKKEASIKPYLGETSSITQVDKTTISFNAIKFIEGLYSFESTPSALSRINPVVFTSIVAIVIFCVINPAITVFAFVVIVVLLIIYLGIAIYKPERAVIVDAHTEPLGDKENGTSDSNTTDYQIDTDISKLAKKNGNK